MWVWHAGDICCGDHSTAQPSTFTSTVHADIVQRAGALLVVTRQVEHATKAAYTYPIIVAT